LFSFEKEQTGLTKVTCKKAAVKLGTERKRRCHRLGGFLTMLGREKLIAKKSKVWLEEMHLR